MTAAPGVRTSIAVFNDTAIEVHANDRTHPTRIVIGTEGSSVDLGFATAADARRLAEACQAAAGDIDRTYRTLRPIR